MKVDGKEYDRSEILMIGVSPERALHPPGAKTEILPCRECGCSLQVSEKAGLVARGNGFLCCPECAVKKYPDVVCGKNPETGQPMTVIELAQRPNLAGVFR